MEKLKFKYMLLMMSLVVRVAKDEDPKIAKQFELVGSGNSWTSTILETCSLQLVSQNTKGEFSKVICLDFRNLDDDYKLIPEKQAPLHKEDRFYSFRNPVNGQGLAALLRDLLQHLRKDGMAKEEIYQVLNEVIKTEFDATENG